MKHIVIFAGGHGAIQLQNSIDKYAGHDNVDVQILISAYDNAKSTLACRKVFNYDILGVSDLRKNHITQFKLQKDMSVKANSDILEWLEYRLPKDWDKDCNDTFNYMQNDYLSRVVDILGDKSIRILNDAVCNFFNQQQAKTISYNDFALSNILYASLANMHQNSLENAGKIMASILGIKNNVHLISNVNLFLHARSENGKDLPDEDIISNWKNAEDRISHIYYVDKNGNEYYPAVDECTDKTISSEHLCQKLIENADIIVFSSGSQWTSLIPTYAQNNLDKFIQASSARKYLVMNNIEDRDLYGVGSSDILDSISKYVDLSSFKIVFNVNAIDSLSDFTSKTDIDKYAGALYAELSDYKNCPVHNAEVFKYIMKDYVKDSVDYSNRYVFDFDDTLYSSKKNSIDVEYSVQNLQLYAFVKSSSRFNLSICSGNKIRHFNAICQQVSKPDILKMVFKDFNCNFGNSICEYDENSNRIKFKGKVFKNISLFEHYFNIVDFLVKNLNQDKKFTGYTSKIDYSNFSNNGDVNISISPLINREEIIDVVNSYIEEYNSLYNTDLYCYINGNTTIDILFKDFTKATCLNEMHKKQSFNYIGDKLDNGNDSSVKSLAHAKCIEIDDIYDTNFILRALKAYVG